MSEEIKINKYNKSITFTNNNIAFSQFGVADEILDLITNLQKQLQKKENIIKEVREYITTHKLYNFKYDEEELFEITTDEKAKDELLGILDKGE